MKAFVTVTQQQFDISAEQGVPEFSAFVTVSQEQFIIIVQDPTGDVLTQSVEFGNFIKGKDGSVIYNGSGVPANTLGVNGDLYIDNVAPNNYYEKISGVWVLQGHFQGEAGCKTKKEFIESDWDLQAGDYVLELPHTLNTNAMASIHYSNGFFVLCDYDNSLTSKVIIYSDIPFNGYALLT